MKFNYVKHEIRVVTGSVSIRVNGDKWAMSGPTRTLEIDISEGDAESALGIEGGLNAWETFAAEQLGDARRARRQLASWWPEFQRPVG